MEQITESVPEATFWSPPWIEEFPPAAVLEVLGNVSEWCFDVIAFYSTFQAVDPARRIARFHLVGFAPEGRFPLAIAFRIADGSDPSDVVPPHGTKGWVRGYFE